MKKFIVLTMFLLVSLSLVFAQTPGRTVYQKLIFDPAISQDICDYVTNTGNTHSPHYILRALHIETGEERGTETYAATVMKIAKLGTAPNQYVAAFFNQSIWPTPWPEGSHLKIRIWCTDATTNPSGVEPYPQYEYAEKTFVVPSGGGAIQMTAAGQEMIVPPFPVIQTDTWTYNLTIQTSDGGAYEFTDPDGVVHTTPITLTDAEGEENSLLGTYTVTSAAPAGFQWESTTIEVVAADFTASAKTAYVYNAVKGFVLVPVPDTYTYTLNIHGPEGGYTVTGPTAALSGTIPYIKTANVVADLLGDYTVAAAPAGYQWVMNPITVSADMFSLVAKKNGGMNKVVLGSRTNGAKANYEYAATITFVLEEIPVQYYTVDITSDPAGAAIYVGGVDTGEITPHQFTLAAGASATYTVMMDHYTWEPLEFAVPNISDNMNCNFVGTPYFDLPNGTAITPPGATVTVTITITGGNANFGSGVLPPWVNPTFAAVEQYFLDLIGAGPWTITFNTTAPWGAYFLSGIWNAVQNVGGTITFTITGAKDVSDLPIVLGDTDPTLPVVLSYFAATLTAENFVNIAWTTQTETNMNGFNIYRNDSDNLASAIQIAYIPATNTSTTQNYKHIDREVENGNTYYYWLECVETNGESTFNGSSPVYVDGPTTPELPNCTIMDNAYPNPFRAGEGTTIKVDVKAGDNGTVTIYNILGQVVKTFPVNQGTNNLKWNARDSKGNLCGNGIYFYKLSTNSLNQTKKMVIVK